MADGQGTGCGSSQAAQVPAFDRQCMHADLSGYLQSLRPDSQDLYGKTYENKKALIVSNTNYQHQPDFPVLAGAKYDGYFVYRAVRKLGFDTDLLQDRTCAQLLQDAHDFANKLQPGDLVLFYYAGHGGQQGLDHFIFCTDSCKTQSQELAETRGVKLDSVIAKLAERNNCRLVLFWDACRKFPPQNERYVAIEPDVKPRIVDQEIVYACLPGERAKDKRDRHGHMAKAIWEHISKPQPWTKIVFDIKKQIFNKSYGQQRPQNLNDALEDFSLRYKVSSPNDLLNLAVTSGEIFNRSVFFDRDTDFTISEFPNELTIRGSKFIGNKKHPEYLHIKAPQNLQGGRAAGVIIEDCVFEGVGLKVSGQCQVQVRNVDVRNAPSSGLLFEDVIQVQVKSVCIEGCEGHGCFFDNCSLGGEMFRSKVKRCKQFGVFLQRSVIRQATNVLRENKRGDVHLASRNSQYKRSVELTLLSGECFIE
eukprot:TRINITY_DN957_c0_g1_i2.p2 TRINITY_DN957_c0_g1~~TRINITY_DN957_c0_g1_i2.p2  ORF type:complete len:519 (-),score=48.09 TRINITY_DN957_c0_g1_i2:788-2218(-)